MNLYFLFIDLAIVAFISNYINIKKLDGIISIFIIIILSLFFGFREGLVLSTDLPHYRDMYNSMTDNFEEFNFGRIELLFGYYIILLKKMSLSDNLFIISTSILFHILLILAIFKFFRRKALLLILIVSTPVYFNYASNTIREGIAFALFFLFAFSLNKKIFKYIILSVFGTLIHSSFIFSAILLWMSSKINISLISFIALFVISLFFFIIDVNSLIFSFLLWIPQVGALERTITYALEIDDNVGTRKFLYLSSIILVILNFYYKDRILKKLSDNNEINIHFYNSLISFIAIALLFYPILSQYGYLIRLFGYVFFLTPILLYGLVYSLFNKTISSILIFIYIVITYSYYVYISNILLV
ncbi:EpsG family protein [Aliarcobacter butzleri]|uniref:EpsG family protein n=1 Tax=Aliarcobacter butzleri TaxID=28197 RepID=UPI0021B50DA4|nr:EpsG family protein [Aliarcobacter butzleri]MCT7650810.1 EpsG family protein [Aliarcobacter butzleri]